MDELVIKSDDQPRHGQLVDIVPHLSIIHSFIMERPFRGQPRLPLILLRVDLRLHLIDFTEFFIQIQFVRFALSFEALLDCVDFEVDLFVQGVDFPHLFGELLAALRQLLGELRRIRQLLRILRTRIMTAALRTGSRFGEGLMNNRFLRVFGDEAVLWVFDRRIDPDANLVASSAIAGTM